MILKEKLQKLSTDDTVLILGYGITGQALAEFCDQKKWKYYVWEDKTTVSRPSSYFQGQISNVGAICLSQPGGLAETPGCSLGARGSCSDSLGDGISFL